MTELQKEILGLVAIIIVETSSKRYFSDFCFMFSIFSNRSLETLESILGHISCFYVMRFLTEMIV